MSWFESKAGQNIGIGQTIIFLPCRLFILFSSPTLSHRMQMGCLPYFHAWCHLSANLECRSEMCCTRLAGNEQELIRRWDSERELFTTTSPIQRVRNFYKASTPIRYLPVHQTEFWNGLARPIRFGFAQQMDTPIGKRNSPGDMAVGNYSLKSTLLPPIVLPKYSLNSRADRN